ncbi:MAG: right-handed parallel beta-helix repeat-containing protein [Rhodothermales bacterium]|nr:right-handed parallel beta-helix repeat-containing protein [Rhodothermales bacterium]MBO6781122.1 right-handed parallel beta-helix repeat-containing protein [Rhodothermales bacterium]
MAIPLLLAALHIVAAAPTTPLNASSLDAPPDVARSYHAGLASVSSVVAADLDGDGFEDLVLGYNTPSGPVLGFLRGNPGGPFPNHPGMRDRGQPFLGPLVLRRTSQRPDLLTSGDFLGTGRDHVAFAAAGTQRIQIVDGIPDASLTTQELQVDAPVLSMTAGEFGLLDGVDELIVGMRDRTLRAGLNGPHETLLQRGGTHLALGHADSGPAADLAVGQGTSVTVLRGEDGSVERLRSQGLVDGMSFGRFGPAGSRRLAIVQSNRVDLFAGLPLRRVVRLPGQFQAGSATVATWRTGAAGQDLLIGDQLIAHEVLSGRVGASEGSPMLPAPARPLVTGAVAMRLNPDALDDLVLVSGGTTPLLLPSGPSATFTVNSTDVDGDGDTTDGICDTGAPGDYTGVCTWGAATQQANASGGSNAISFAIPGAGPFVLSGGATFSGPVTIDGSTQPGFAGQPLIVLADARIALEAGNSTVRSVLFTTTDANNRPASNLEMIEVGNNTVTGVWMGLDQTGSVSDPDGTPGTGDELGAFFNVWIRTPNNTIGGASETARNVVSGAYDGDGILISGPNASGNLVEGNYVGLNPAGTEARGNNFRGIALCNASSSNTVRGNVVSGNSLGISNGWEAGAGISIEANSRLIVAGGTDPVDQPPRGNLVVGNLIGTNAAGDTAIPNERGVFIDHAFDNTIGGSTEALRNVISGNAREGVYAVAVVGSTSDNLITGNHVGTDLSGAVALANQREGIRLNGVGTQTITANLISGNGSRGIAVESSSGITISDNRIGSNAAAAAAIGNSSSGIQIASSSNITVGSPGAGNTIVSNGGGGIFISGSSTGATVQGNAVGTDATGTLDLGNSFDGIRILGDSLHTIGGTGSGQGNVIAYNAMNGIGVWNGSRYQISGNSIFANDSLGIDLGIDGVTLNDAGDADTGQNGLQNFPQLGFLDSERVRVTFAGPPSTTFTLEFFANEACDPSDYGEGRRFLDAESVTTNGLGALEYVRTFALNAEEEYITATATDANGNTSEFSRCSDDLRLIVNTVGDAPDADVNDPVCDTGTDVMRGTDEEPECTLRAAIQQAEENDGLDEITFDIIEGSAPYTVTVGSQLPTIDEEVNIDATTQSGYQETVHAVRLSGGGQDIYGLLAFADLTVSGMEVREFGSGIVSRGGNLTLHDIAAKDNAEFGLHINDSFPDSVGATGQLLIEANGPADNCDQLSGMRVMRPVTTETLIVRDNCHHGVWNDIHPVVVLGNLTATRNGGTGLRATNVELRGTQHSVLQNGGSAIVAQAALIVDGDLTVRDNGPLGQPECEQEGRAAIRAQAMLTDALTVTGNCYDAVYASVDGVVVRGNTEIVNNRTFGIRAGWISLQGDENLIQANGHIGLRAESGSVTISGPTELQFNGKDGGDSCAGSAWAAVSAATDVTATDLRIHGNCGLAIEAGGTVTVSERLTATSNEGGGVKASDGHILLDGADNIISGNGGIGLQANGQPIAGVRMSGPFTVNTNQGSGIVAGVALLTGAGTVCRNVGWGLEVAPGPIDLAGTTVCDNTLGGVLLQAESSAGKGGARPLLTGVTVVGNGGDGIRFAGGAAFSVTASNLFGNAGPALNNLVAETAIVADGNWWGSPSGPGSQVAGNVTVSSHLSAPPANTDSDGDGVADAMEDLGTGDGNGDGTPDSAQPDVASLPSAVDGRTIVIVTDGGAPLSEVRSISAPADSAAHPAGYVDARIGLDSGASGTVTIHLPAPPDANYVNFTSYGARSPGGTEVLFSFPQATLQDSVATLSVTDGAAGDADQEANGSFHLVGGGSIAAPTSTESRDAPASFDLAVFPNPFRGTLSVRVPPSGDTRIDVYDALGRSVLQHRMPQGGTTARIQASDWAAGVYFVVIRSGGARVSRAVLKTH